jgi:glucose dehydrogenase
MNWYHQYVPGDMWDYDAAGSHILIDGEIAGQPHKLVTHSARNGFLYALERTNAVEVADIFRDHGAAWRRANRGHVSPARSGPYGAGRGRTVHATH